MLRTSLRFTGLCAGLLLSASALALSLGDLSQSDASGGLKDALTQGAQIAVKQLSTLAASATTLTCASNCRATWARRPRP